MCLSRFRINPFVVEVDGVLEVIPYMVDSSHISEEKIMSLLLCRSREEIKKGLSLLSSDFRALFHQAPKFRNTKDENKFYFNILCKQYEKFKMMDLDSFFEAKEDEIYRECQYLEEEIKNPYSFGVEKKKAELEKLVNFDTQGWVEKQHQYICQELETLINFDIAPFYVSGSRAMKAEQRHRETLFIRIMMGLCYFLDLETVPKYTRYTKDHSILEILAVGVLESSNFEDLAYMHDSFSDFVMGWNQWADYAFYSDY